MIERHIKRVCCLLAGDVVGRLLTGNKKEPGFSSGSSIFLGSGERI
jgi:hypothetical protein